MRKTLLLFFVMAILIPIGATENNFYNIGNKFYEEAQYDSAAVYYEIAIKKYGHNPDIYYNLGNAYFKMRKLGKTILNYKKALILAPRSKEIKYNLAFAESFLRDDIKSVRTGFLYKIYSSIIGLLSFRELIFLIIILSVLTTIFGIFTIFNGGRILKNLCLGFGIALLVFVSIYAFKKSDDWETRTAIIITPEFHVRSAPGETSELLFSLHEGTEVVILERRDEWARIRIKDGKEGWGKAGELENVVD